MKFKSIQSEFSFPFAIRPSELKLAQKRLETWGKKNDYMPELNRSFDVTRKRRGMRDDGSIQYRYNAQISYSPQPNVEFKLIDHDLMHLQLETDLPFKKKGFISLTPADLVDFTRPWHYSEGHIIVGKNVEGNTYRIQTTIVGEANKTQRKDLSDFCDQLCLPVKKGDSWWTAYSKNGAGEGGNSHPVIVMFKKFIGDINIDAEILIEQYYQNIKKYVAEQGITSGFKKNELTIEQIAKKNYRTNLNDVFEKSSAASNGVFAPEVSICAIMPVTTHIKPEFTNNGKKYVKRYTQQSMIFNTSSRSF
jgi:hypothetical protein